MVDSTFIVVMIGFSIAVLCAWQATGRGRRRFLVFASLVIIGFLVGSSAPVPGSTRTGSGLLIVSGSLLPSVAYLRVARRGWLAGKILVFAALSYLSTWLVFLVLLKTSQLEIT